MKKLFKLIINRLFKIKLENLDKLDFSEPTILMPNHTSLLDAIILALNLPDDVCFVVNTEIAKKYAFLVNMTKHITVGPLNPFSIRQIIKEVKSGKTLLIFPEGRITTTGGLMKIYGGAAHVALKSNAKIYPITIRGLERSKLSYLQDKVTTRIFPRVFIRVGNPFYIAIDAEKSLKTQKIMASDNILKIMQAEQVISSSSENTINLFNKLLDIANEADENRLIIEDITQKVSYKKLLLSSYALSAKFKDKTGVGVLLPNSVAHVATLFALFKNGITPSILNFSIGQQNLLDCCETAEIKEILTSREFINKAKLDDLSAVLAQKIRITYLEDVKASITLGDKLKSFFCYLFKKRSGFEDGNLIMFTSGSESKPKGVVLSHRNIYYNIQQAKSVIDITERDKFLNVLPMYHSFGLTAGTLLPVLSNFQVFLYPTPLHYRIIPEIAYDKNCTILFGTSTFLKGYGKNAHIYDFYSLRYVYAGAENLKEDVRELWIDKFGIRIFEGYGTTEASPILSLNTPLLNKKGSVGCLLPGIEYKLEPVEGIESGGDLLVKGANLMKGYLIHGEGFKPLKDWYRTGDIVEIDAQGFITIKSRLKRFAKVAGEMVSLDLCEEVAAECFGTSNLATIATSDPSKGEKIILFMTEEGHSLKTLRAYIRSKNLSLLLMPSELSLIDKIPLLGSGKTDYVTLQKQ
ncbi:MAG: AMP-binding protein [Desulfosporosinus sp.]|nr:AMP-binding protein [Desulfosporosinus sp.]